MAQHILSFGFIDGYSFKFGPVHVSISNLEFDTIKKTVNKIIDEFEKHDDYFQWNDEEKYLTNTLRKESNIIYKELSSNKYYVWNRFEKYYSIVFAIDYTQFGIFGKGNNAELINWKKNTN